MQTGTQDTIQLEAWRTLDVAPEEERDPRALGTARSEDTGS